MKAKYENKSFIFKYPIEYNFKSLISKLKRNVGLLLLRFLYIIRKRPKVTPKEYNVCVCAIFKQEAFYLKEWIEFHLLVGIEHFFLYNNNSSDNYLEVLEPYLNNGIVTLIDWPEEHPQRDCYRDCIKKYSQKTKWLGFIDIDEFVVPKKFDNLYDFLKTKEHYPSVIFYWKYFGANGLISRNKNNLVIEDFTLAWPKFYTLGKVFYNTAYQFVDDIEGANKYLFHRMFTKGRIGNLPPINCLGRIDYFDNKRLAPSNYSVDDFPVQLNHYFTKSLAEYEIKNQRGDVFRNQNNYNLDLFYNKDSKAIVQDFSAWKYLIKLKQNINR